jgi:dTDP-4-amino-4,6-dideoxygalactose transaminase
MRQSIPFNKPAWFGAEEDFISEAFANNWVSGDGPFTKKVESRLRGVLDGCDRVLLTTSCTHALEMAAILLDLQPGDEVIVPSYTFVTTALAFYMHGARPVFADIRPDTMNIDESKIEDLVTDRTRAIVPVHYAGVGCEMDEIGRIADKHDLVVVEDNAHGLFGSYKNRALGTLADLATQSFHETKNLTCGEGGALVINSGRYTERAEIIREKGTNRSKFFRGEIDKYSWCDKGSSYVMSDILAAFLYGQLQHADEIQSSRRSIWNTYNRELSGWARNMDVALPYIPEHCEQAYHMFYLVMPDYEQRTRFISNLKSKGIHPVFHYLPLNESEMGVKLGGRNYPCPVSADISNRLVRLPFYSSMSAVEQEYIIENILQYSI